MTWYHSVFIDLARYEEVAWCLGIIVLIVYQGDLNYDLTKIISVLTYQYSLSSYLVADTLFFISLYLFLFIQYSFYLTFLFYDGGEYIIRIMTKLVF